ncbi:MAG: hypothetical protein M9953_06390 [Thermomicrobiales bacterium]|nr:hypothetical protein [Thermomicrobiales bacterium]
MPPNFTRMGAAYPWNSWRSGCGNGGSGGNASGTEEWLGLGDQQRGQRGAVTVTQWVVWVYAVLILTGVRCPPSIRHSRRWYRQRRWTPRDLTMQLREELMTAPPRQVTPHCAWFRTNLTENTALKVLLAVADAI